MTNTFRKEYRPLSPEAKDDMFAFKSIADNLEHEFHEAGKRDTTDKRCMQLAIEKLEESIMWSVKAIT